MKRKVRIGIIGAGAIGASHLKALADVPTIERAALCDPLADRLAQVAGENSVEQTFADHRKMLKQADIDAVYVCTPNFLHCGPTIDALKAGKHVFCEKPMALNAAQARKMVASARKARKVLQLGMSWRQQAETQTLKQFIDKGVLGRIYHMRVILLRRRGIPGLGGWFTTKAASGGGGLIDIGVHYLDLAMWLSGQWDPKRVSAATYAEFGPRMRDYVYTGMWAGPPKFDGVFDVDDYAAGMVRFPKKVTLSFEISWAANCENQALVELMGDKGGARACTGQGLTIFTEENRHIVDIKPQYAAQNHYMVQGEKFADAILHGKTPPATGEQGLTVMRLLDAIYKSARLDREVTLGG